MKDCLQLNKVQPSVGLKPGTASSAGQHSPFARAISVISLGTCIAQLQTNMFDYTTCETKFTL